METQQQNNIRQALVYKVGEEEVTLSRNIVRQYLTRGSSGVTDAEIVQFMALCQANKLNPFVGDAYLVKYQGSPAQMITAKDAFMKRAETGPNYEGFTAGVIVLRNNEVLELEGSFTLPSDTLVGGWCKVYRGDRAQPFLTRVSIKEYHTGKSTWAKMPGTMIRKVAIAQAFREAYPVNMSGLYVPEEEVVAPDDQPQEEAPAVPANSIPVSLPTTEDARPQDEGVAAPAPELAAVAQPLAAPELAAVAQPLAAPEAEDSFDTRLFDPEFKGQ